MFDEILSSLLITSFAGSVLAGIITLLSPVTRKHFGYSWQYYIWLAVLAVLILPVRVSLSQSKMTAPPVRYAQETQEISQTAEAEPEPQEIGHAPTLQTAAPSKVELMRQIIIGNNQKALCIVWLTGACAFLLWYLAGYALMRRKIRKNSVEIACPELRQYTDKKVRVLSCGAVNVPFMTGVFRPALILPQRAFTGEQLNNILRHETTHLKRRDILYKWFATLVKCVHWFNPVVWYAVRQIGTECEISCDLSVVAEMNNEEETGYVDTILSMLSAHKTKTIPLTTGMAGSKKIIKRRLEMMKNKKRTSKIMSVLSAVIAVFMLSATVFASGVLSDFAADDYTVVILNNGEKLELENPPFIENGEVYVPLRETFEKVGLNGTNGRITWNDGKIRIAIVQDNGIAGLYGMEIGKTAVDLRHIQPEEFDTATFDNELYLSIDAYAPPVLKGSVTYVSMRDMDYMLYKFLNMRFSDNSFYELTYQVYDKNGNVILDDAQVILTSPYENSTPQYTVDQFFKNIELSRYEQADRYCSDEVAGHYHDDTPFSPQKLSAK